MQYVTIKAESDKDFDIRKLERVQPLDYLDKGTAIVILSGPYKGEVVKTIKEKDQNGQPINVFRVKYLQKYKSKQWVDVKPRIADINYSGIALL